MLPIVRDGWISPSRSYLRSVCGCMPSISAAMLMKIEILFDCHTSVPVLNRLQHLDTVRV